MLPSDRPLQEASRNGLQQQAGPFHSQNYPKLSHPYPLDWKQRLARLTAALFCTFTLISLPFIGREVLKWWREGLSGVELKVQNLALPKLIGVRCKESDPGRSDRHTEQNPPVGAIHSDDPPVEPKQAAPQSMAADLQSGAIVPDLAPADPPVEPNSAVAPSCSRRLPRAQAGDTQAS